MMNLIRSKRSPVLSGSPILHPALIYTGILILCLVSGFLVASNYKLALFLIGALGALAVVAQPSALLWMTTITTLVVMGSLKFFAGGVNIFWVAYGMGSALFASVLLYQIKEIGRYRQGTVRAKVFNEHGYLRAIIAVALLICSIFLALIFGAPAYQVVTFLKSSAMFGGVWCVLAMYPFSEDTIKNWLKGIIIIGLAQFPAALYQFLFITLSWKAKGDAGQSAADVVVGTFGGNPEGSGLTGALAVFLVMMLIMAVALYHHKIVDRRQFIFMSALYTAPLLMMEVKVIFFYLPVCLFVLFREQVYRQPVKFAGGALVTAVLLIGVMLSYQYVHWSGKKTGLEDTLLQVFSYSFDPETGKAENAGFDPHLTRLGVYIFWWEENGFSKPLNTLLGNGLGGSRTGGLASGAIGKTYYPINIDRTGWAVILWDIGIVGFAFVLLLFALQFRSAGRLAKSRYLSDWQRALAAGLQATTPLFVMSPLYRNDIPYAAPMMFIVMCHFGLVSWLVRQASKKELELAARH